jgi:hypothetical protein
MLQLNEVPIIKRTSQKQAMYGQLSRPYIDTGLFRNETFFFSKESQGKYNLFIPWDGG